MQARVTNAFELAAARRAARADAVPLVRRQAGGLALAMDRLGRRLVPLAPRVQVGFVIESRAQAQASVLRRAAMRRRSI